MEEGCPRVEQCDSDPCLNDGECVDLWTSYQCNCKRPYLGDNCELSEYCTVQYSAVAGMPVDILKRHAYCILYSVEITCLFC